MQLEAGVMERVTCAHTDIALTHPPESDIQRRDDASMVTGSYRIFGGSAGLIVVSPRHPPFGGEDTSNSITQELADRPAASSRRCR